VVFCKFGTARSPSDGIITEDVISRLVLQELLLPYFIKDEDYCPGIARLVVRYYPGKGAELDSDR
jgi:hypothetical protein